VGGEGGGGHDGADDEGVGLGDVDLAVGVGVDVDGGQEWGAVVGGEAADDVVSAGADRFDQA